MTPKIMIMSPLRTTSINSDVEGRIVNKCVCDKCGAEFDVTPRHKADGDLDIVYLVCPHCEEEYLVSVTDSVFREAIEKCRELMVKASTATDAETSDKLARMARVMKTENHNRCKALIEEYKNK